MSSLFEFLIVFIILMIIGVILFSLGRGTSKKIEETPYASGEQYPPIKITYRTIKLFYAALFAVIDAAAVLLVFMGELSFSLPFIGFWLLIVFSLLLLVKLRREIE
ncbi:MAG: hypothetical protein GWO20_00125 [Candidatus Korarchaeota archaeon]|nr:hypothetical protein [Candidatus Korarchaeota archaeon]NIU81896.1 hypothetical protein [Candidatus Thorarchaeota archaeon]NIW12354.1 hypothetical protein [Candidatus Thorarchaeota archaeon]NIW50624.1 hypothetical protein [Candidatus Korarchaeota archaeon]